MYSDRATDKRRKIPYGNEFIKKRGIRQDYRGSRIKEEYFCN